MKTCPFCNLDKDNVVNTIIEETNNFFVTPSKGSLCTGYLLIFPKKHLLSMNQLGTSQKQELQHLIIKYRDKFKSIFGSYPIIFEHGTGENNKNSSSSIVHAHCHIVNHNFLDENKVIQDINLRKVTVKEFFENKMNSYISYISPTFDYYISYDFKPKNQQMRILIAEDLNIESNYNWRDSNFDDNIIKTINLLK